MVRAIPGAALPGWCDIARTPTCSADILNLPTGVFENSAYYANNSFSPRYLKTLRPKFSMCKFPPRGFTTGDPGRPTAEPTRARGLDSEPIVQPTHQRFGTRPPVPPPSQVGDEVGVTSAVFHLTGFDDDGNRVARPAPNSRRGPEMASIHGAYGLRIADRYGRPPTAERQL